MRKLSAKELRKISGSRRILPLWLWRLIPQRLRKRWYKELVKESEDWRFYCIVCQKMIDPNSVQSITASFERGGWYCGYHSEAELEQAKKRLQGKHYDRLGGSYNA